MAVTPPQAFSVLESSDLLFSCASIRQKKGIHLLPRNSLPVYLPAGLPACQPARLPYGQDSMLSFPNIGLVVL